MLAESQRRQMLAAMDIDVYVLREVHAVRTETRANDSAGAWLIVAAPDTAMKSTQCAQLRKSLPFMLGVTDDRVRWIVAEDAGSFDPVPSANAYLVLGAALARSLVAQLTASQQNAAVIAVADEPAISFGTAMSKRALWQTLKPIARRVREAR
jgi:hypothetical protein